MPEGNGVIRTAAAMVRAAGSAMAVTLRNLFRAPVTVHYPDTVRTYPDRYRGLLALTYDKETGEENCIGCRLCEFVCPPKAIRIHAVIDVPVTSTAPYLRVTGTGIVSEGNACQLQASGPVAAVGPQGDPGPQGPQGPAGADGAQGLREEEARVQLSARA